MTYKFLGLIEMNESEYLISSAVGSATIGWPDFKMLIVDTLIKGINEVNSNFMEIMLIIKFVLFISSFYWIYKLINNIEFTYNRHSSATFENYMKNLVLVGIVVFLFSTLIRWIIF